MSPTVTKKVVGVFVRFRAPLLLIKKANILLKYFVKDTDILHVTNGLGFYLKLKLH
jgi:hypothetical protein